jgi:hypothetical protein
MASPPRGIRGSLRSMPDLRGARPAAQPHAFSRPRSPSKHSADPLSPSAKPGIVLPRPVGSTTLGKAKVLSGLTPLQPMNSPLVPENAEQPSLFDGNPADAPAKRHAFDPAPPDAAGDPPPQSMLVLARRAVRRPR